MHNNNNTNINLRLTKLEEFYLSLSAHLEGERVLRKEEDEKCKQLCDLIAKQIIEMRETQPNESFTKRFASMQDQFLNVIESKIDQKILENKNRLEAQYINMKTNEETINKKIENEFNQYKFEINNINERLEFIENTYNKKLKDISNKIEEINNNQNNLRIFNNDILNKINNINQKINQIETNKKIDINNKIKNIEDRIEDITLLHKENEEKNNVDLNSINSNLAFLKNDFSSLTENYMKEIEEIKGNLNKQNALKNKEITNFEQHILGEYENFTKFITNILNQNIEKIKSMNDYLNSDVEIIKNKNKYLEETLLKLREDIYDSLKKNSKYILDKMYSYFNLQMDNKNIICNPDKDENYGIENEEINNNKNII